MFKADRIYGEMLAMEEAVERMVVDGPESLAEYFRLQTLLIFNFKQVGLLYDLYADDAVVYRENGGRLRGAGEVMRDAAAFLGAFPDLSITFADTFAVAEGEGYKLWRHYQLDGTNLGPSLHGPPTGKSLGGDKCLVMGMATVEAGGGRPRIVKEFTMYSAYWIRSVCGG